MSQSAAWQKPVNSPALSQKSSRIPFIVGGIPILAAIVFLIMSSTLSGARFFITVDELMTDAIYVDQSVRVSGVVLGDTIVYDAQTLTIEFTVAHVPNEFDDLGSALHLAANNPQATRMQVRVENQVKPDLLRHEAQAIMTGTLGADGVFHATELNLKCPTRFIEGMPDSLRDDGILEGA
jgi:cytochrome c-type biogenesis protein CcmE